MKSDRAIQTMANPIQRLGRHDLVRDEHADEELQDRGDVLEQAHHGERHPDRGGGEAEQRNGGDHARPDQEQRVARTRAPEGGRPLRSR